MLIRDFKDCAEFRGSDDTLLREFLHPDKTDAAIRYSLAHATLKPGRTSRPHALKTSEVYFILEGRGIMHIDGESAEVRPGQAVYIPPDSRQYIQNNGDSDLKFLCIVEPAWKKEDEKVF